MPSAPDLLGKVRRMGVLRRRLAVLASAILLGLPASAGAQSAGDDQYEDPFAGEQDQGQAQTGGGGEEQAPAATPAPAQAPETAATASVQSAPATQAELPYTGAAAGAVLIAGATLLAGGVALRVRVRERP